MSLAYLSFGNIYLHSNIRTWFRVIDRLVVYFYRIDACFQLWRATDYIKAVFDYSCKYLPCYHCSMPFNVMYIFYRHSERCIYVSFRRWKGIQSLNQSRTFVPGSLFGFSNQVISFPGRNRNKDDFRWIIAYFLKMLWKLFLHFIKSILTVLNTFVIHFVAADNQLFKSKNKRKESMIFGRPFFRKTILEISRSTWNNKESTIRLVDASNSTFDHVLMSRGIEKGDFPCFGRELVGMEIDGNPSFPLNFEFIDQPRVLIMFCVIFICLDSYSIKLCFGDGSSKVQKMTT